MINGADSFPLLAVPFFMLAGEIMNVGGLSRRIVDLAITLVGHLRGGLGFVAILAAVLMAALSGSAVADTAALASLLLPMMVAAGHDRGRAGGLIASAGIIAPIIPPSIGFVIFGVAANLSIGKLFLAGIFPGLLMGAALAVTWYVVRQARRRHAAAQGERAPSACRRCKNATWALLLPVIVLVGLKFGIFTPTEAAVVAAVYALFVATVVYRELKLKQLYDVFLGAAKTTAVIMFLVAAAMVSAWLITVADLPSKMVELLQPFMGNQTLLLIAIMVLLIAIGTAMDMTPTILIMTPVLMPVVKAAGIDPIYFGVLFIMNSAIGLITPPVGTVLNVDRRRRQDEHERSDPRRDALHAGPVRRDVPAGPVPVARHRAGTLARRLIFRPRRSTHPTRQPFPYLPQCTIPGDNHEILDPSPHHPRRRRRGPRLRQRLGAGQGAHLQARDAEPEGPPAGGRRAEVRRARRGQVGRQDEGPGVPGRRARRRRAERLGAAGRHPGDGHR